MKRPLETDNYIDIITGFDLESNGNITEAISHYKKMIRNLSYPGYAVGRLAGIKNRSLINNIQNYFETLLTNNVSYKPAVQNLIAGMYLNDGRYDDAVQLYNNIISAYPNTFYATNALFEKFFAALHHANNITISFTDSITASILKSNRRRFLNETGNCRESVKCFIRLII